MPPHLAVFFSGVFNFLGVLLGGVGVAYAIVHLLPVMPVNVKTPRFPLQLAGETRTADVEWQIEQDADSLLAKAYRDEKLVGYIAGGTAQMQGLALLRQLSI